MCGIAGLFQLAGPAGEREIEIVTRMTNSLQHRGPDAWGVNSLGRAVLGHRRLAIIDLSAAGNQPMSDARGKVWITYNGEIYNSPQLRRELEEKGRWFRSSSDTEVLIQGYQQWGIEGVLERLRGMFAFALLDLSEEHSELFLARDRIGIKPLYYYRSGTGGLLFASELRALIASGVVPRSADRKAFLEYLQWGTVPDPNTAIEGVQSLLPGSYLRVQDRLEDPRSYWSLADSFRDASEPAPGRASVLVELRSWLEETVKLHQLSDVPVGLFLSGGIDSASLALLAAAGRDDPLRTISVSFDEAEFSEEDIARQVASLVRSQHTEVKVSAQDFMTQMEDVLSCFDQPTIDGVNTYYVSWAARQCGLKVVLSGAGGDELFLGYPQAHSAANGDRLSRLLSRLSPSLRRTALLAFRFGGRLAGRQGIDRAEYLNRPGVDAYYRLYRGLFSPDTIQRLTKAGAEEIEFLYSLPGKTVDGDFLKGLVLREFEGYLRNQLLRDTDVMGMAHSLEVRVPFLDHLLVEQVSRWPDAYKFRPGVNKALLVDAMQPALPREVWDRPKQGFVFPLDGWIRQKAERFRAEALSCDWLDSSAVEDVWTRFLKRQIHWTRPWATLVWARWQESIR